LSLRDRLVRLTRPGIAVVAEEVVSFEALQQRAAHWAGALLRLHVRAGDPVVAVAVPSLDAIAAMLGAYRIGAIWVPVHAKYRRAEIEHVIVDSAAKLVLHSPGLHAEVPAIVDVHAMADVEGEAIAEIADVDDDATALVVYTSGTTGKSKGVELSYRAIVSSIEGLAAHWGFGDHDTMSLQLPLHHVHGLCVGVHGALLSGATIRLHASFSVQSVIDDIADRGATIFMGVPTMYARILRHLDAHPRDGERLARARLFTAGSAALPADLLQRFEAHTGHRIVERYGMTETLITLSNPLHGERRAGSVGLPLPGVHIRVIDDDGVDAPEGELLVQGPGLMTCYRGRPHETEAAFDGPWFRTGDVVARDPDGYVRIVGRSSVDIIKSGGFKIATREIEDVLARHELVREVAVFGVPDPEWGETIAAAVVPTRAIRDAELLAILQAHCREHLTDYKQPRRVLVLEALPRNAMGKVVKPELRALSER
jgi:acyl-CoA synthetase (AMP-forming)/AMP-acid ligase II